MRVLLIDNYDSYTFNLFQTLGPECLVIRNDQPFVKDNLLSYFDCIIISPGPGTPEKKEVWSTQKSDNLSKDFGICLDLLEYIQDFPIPIFGVCLGHQGIGSTFGAKVVLADTPMHGIPVELEIIAWAPSSIESQADTIMGLQHKYLPLWGVQFHPESICTEYGDKLVDNFLKLAERYWTSRNPTRNLNLSLPQHISKLTVIPSPLLNNSTLSYDMKGSTNNPLFKRVKTAHITQLNKIFDSSSNFSELVFEKLFSNSSDENGRFWLDSAKVEKGLSRFSYMGSCDSLNSYILTYSTQKRIITVASGDNKHCVDSENQIPLERPEDTFFHFMTNIAAKHGFWNPLSPIALDIRYNDSTIAPAQLPDFLCGYVGYFGYEMKCESMSLPPRSSGFKTISSGPETPDSAYLFCDRVVAFDHETGSVWLVTLEFEDASGELERHNWIEYMRKAIENIGSEKQNGKTVANTVKAEYKAEASTFSMRDDKEQYISNINSSLQSIKQGESYEVCLTTKLALTIRHNSSSAKSEKPTPFEVYERIRAKNPAPYAAFIQIPRLNLSVLQSSPERFLRFDGKEVVEMKPIKGTVARPVREGEYSNYAKWLHEDESRKTALQNNEKDRAENLMIVDLIRNDLNQISKSKSVHVPKLMHVESYATVHQLVSTIRCLLRDDLTPLDAIRATFPPGSMTGAPKVRTVEILEDLEKGPRGLYSGCLGFMSAGSGVVDMAVVIRTAVMMESDATTRFEIGAGGAIVFLSDPVDEFDEMNLKANSVLPSQPPNLYEILDIPITATTKQISKAYRNRALKYHPDKVGSDDKAAGTTKTTKNCAIHSNLLTILNGWNTSTADMFLLLSQAYEVLTDPEKRATYDEGHKALLAKKERFEKLDSKRRQAREELEKREAEGMKRAKTEDFNEAEIKRLREDGMRRLAEMLKKDEEEKNQKQKRDAETATTTPSKNSLDHALSIKWKNSKVNLSATEIESMFSPFGTIEIFR
ncbi:hypothetical protein HK100_005714, partial [Physocladia obscura]